MGSRSESVRVGARWVVAGIRWIGSTVALSSGLNPDDGVNSRVRGRRGRARSEAGVLPKGDKWASDASSLHWRAHLIVAPIGAIARIVLLSRTALVNDEVSWEASCGEKRAEVLDVGKFVEALLRLVSEAIVVGYVGANATDPGAGVDGLGHGEDLRERARSWTEVSWPSKPSIVCSINVNSYIRELTEPCDGQRDGAHVDRRSSRTLGHRLVGDD